MSWRFSFMFSYSPDQHLRSFLWLRTLCSAMLQRSIADPAQVRGMCCRAGSEICAVCISRYSNRSQNSRTPQRSCRAAHGAKHLPFCAAAIRRRRLSQWGIETRHWTSRILTYPALIEAGVFPTEINQFIFYKIFATISCRMRTKIEKGPPQFRETTQFTADSVQSCAIYRSL